MNAVRDRKPIYQLRLHFSGSIDEVENWLESNCDGVYSYQLEDITETDTVFSQLDLLFEFSNDNDRKKFKDAVVQGQF